MHSTESKIVDPRFSKRAVYEFLNVLGVLSNQVRGWKGS
jgi:hypothetical protein